VIAALAGRGYDVKCCCRILWRAAFKLFRLARPAALGEGATARVAARPDRADPCRLARCVYGYRWVRVELRLGRQIVVSRKLVHKLMGELRRRGLPARKQRWSLANVATAEDLVCREFTRAAPNQL